MGSTDDIHNFPRRYKNALEQLDKAAISERSKEIIRRLARHDKKKGNKLSTISNTVNTLRWIAVMVHKDLDTITEDDYDNMIERLELDGKYTSNYVKAVKKLFDLTTDGSPPRWVEKTRIPQHKTRVQPGDLLTKEEITKLLNACKHPRDKALIAVILDSCMRIGAVGTLRIKHLAFNQCGAVLYMSTTSKNNKSTPPKPCPITWSTGYLNAWLDVHPGKSDPEAPLWTVLKGDKIEAMTYSGLVMLLKKITKRAGLESKKIHYHLFKHQEVTRMILEGYSDREIRFKAGWSPNSAHMFDIYGNFYSEDMVNSIYAREGLSPPDKRHVTLQKCPRCHVVLKPDMLFCPQCSLALSASAAKSIEDRSEVLSALFETISSDPEILQRFQKLAQKQA